MRRLTSLFAFALATALAAQAPPSWDALADVESALLEERLERYADTRREERQAWRQVEELSAELDAALTDSNRQVERLRQAEKALGTARELAASRARESAARRQELYLVMDRFDALSAVAERQRSRTLQLPARLPGRWEIDLGPLGQSGRVEWTVRGTLVTAIYRMEGGAIGALSGTLVGDRLELERVDGEAGFDLTLEGEVSAGETEIEGTWERVDVSGGAPSAGPWSALRQ